MEPGVIILYVIVGAFGVVIGMLLQCLRTGGTKTMGTIYAYYDADKPDPSLLLEYNVSIDDIASRRRVMFNVKTIRQNSQE